MSSSPLNEQPQETPGDPIDALLRDARFSAPEGLAARLAARARDPQLGKLLFWADVERLSRTLVGKVAVAAVLAAGLALGVAYSTNPDNMVAVTTVTDSNDVTLDDVTRLTVAPSSLDAIVLDSSSASGVGSPSVDAEDR